MTETEFALSGCFNKHCKYIFDTGEIAYGVITLFSDSPNVYYLVRSNNMIAVKDATDKNELSLAKSLSEKINIHRLKQATLLIDIQKLTCPECQMVFEFDPNANQQVVTSLNESYRPQKNTTLEVTAYLTCPKGHTYPYKVKKQY